MKNIKMSKEHLITAIKYLFSVVIVFLTYHTARNYRYILCSLVELAVIFLISDSLVRRSRYFNILNGALMLIFNAQTFVLIFSKHYVLLVMLDNLDMIADISGNAVIYITGVILALVFSFLPVRPLVFTGKWLKGVVLCMALALEISLVTISGQNSYSPLKGLWSLAVQYREHEAMKALIEDMRKEDRKLSEEIQTGAEPGAEILLPAAEHITVPEGTNVMVIFMEGLSDHIVTDERGVMPRLRAFRDASISFSDYYDHTFATYRALQGQLFSDHQMGNYDTSRLDSIMSVLRDRGYTSVMINPEPGHPYFDPFLESLGFDRVISDTSNLDGVITTMSDRACYNFLFDTAMDIQKPFFISVYTFGTHASYDSVYEVFGDGSDPELNKFYDSDYQFGEFFDRFIESPLADNTMLIFTADHATFADEGFTSAFPKHPRTSGSCDEIPLMIYYRGNVQTVEAAGRNSLDFAPTVLDLMGIEPSGDFLGESLFAPKTAGFRLDTFFWDPDSCIYTGNDRVENVDEDTRALVTGIIAKHCAKK